jgi:plasmid maintenance system antidote protein VapI
MKIKINYESIMKKISSYLKELKVLKGHKYDSELIESLGVTKGMLSGLMNGTRMISLKKCLIVSKEHGVSPEVLILTMLYEKEKDAVTKKELKDIVLRLSEKP